MRRFLGMCVTGVLIFGALFFWFRPESAVHQTDRVSGGVREMVIRDVPIKVEVARTPEDRARGLMYREVLPEGTGMVFLFEDEVGQIFWNKHTFIPLDILWVRDEKVIGISSLPNVRDAGIVRVASPEAVDAVIELPAGWSSRYSIRMGDPAHVDSLR